MRRLLVLLFAGACNQVYGIETTSSADPNNPFDPQDHDLDGINNFDDNCPSLANETQDDEDADGVGDVCDQHLGDATDRIVERTFFADPAFARERWYSNNFDFEPRAVVSGDESISASLQSRRSYEDRFLSVEIGVEMITWNSNPYIGGIRIELDDVGGPSAELRRNVAFMTLVAGPARDSMNQDHFEPEIGVGIPIRLVQSYDRDTTTNVARVGAAQSMVDVPPLPPGPVTLAAVECAARIKYVVIYGRN